MNEFQEKLSGIVERITFHNPENGFCVLKVKTNTEKDIVTVIGNTHTIAIGESVKCIGQWITDKTHGSQFKADAIENSLPIDLEGIEKYLSSGLIKGIGPVYARKMIKAFGANIFNVMDENAQALQSVLGIGALRFKIIKDSWGAQKTIREIIVFLHKHGINTAKANKIYKTYGERAIFIIEADPYCLVNDIKGINFQSADKIAEALGIEKDSKLRIKAGINFVLYSATNQGSCGLPTRELIPLAQELLEIQEDLIKKLLNSEISSNNYVVENINNEECIFLKELAKCEQQIAEALVAISKGKLAWPSINSKKEIDSAMNETSIKLSSSQQEAIKWVLCSRFSAIIGGPGTGKTTLINLIIRILSKFEVKFLLSAPTGRAAKRLAEATGAAATTIHRLLKKSLDQDFRKVSSIDCDLLIIDEASMLDITLMNAILNSLPNHAALILVGDRDQLPSIGPGQVLADIIDSGGLTILQLNEIFRQNKESNIITNAHSINQGLMPLLKSNNANKINDFYFIENNSPEEVVLEIVELVKKRLPAKFNISPFTDIQVLSPMTKGILGTKNLNIELQNILVPYNASNIEVEAFGNRFRINDKVMQIINNYDKDVFNGDMGKISMIDKAKQEITVNFDNRDIIYAYSELEELLHAYAITIHKSQGSEYNYVIIPLMMQHYKMLKRNLIYTAVTRAKKMVIIIGQKQAMQIAVQNISAVNRYTTLKQRLQNLDSLREIF